MKTRMLFLWHVCVLTGIVFHVARAVTNEELRDMLVTLTESEDNTQSQLRELRQELRLHQEERRQITLHLADLVQDVRTLVTHHENADIQDRSQPGIWSRLESSLNSIQEKVENVQHTVLTSDRQCSANATTTAAEVTTIATPADGGSICGSIALTDPQDRGPDGWFLCYITTSKHAGHVSTACQDLIKNVKSPTTGRVFADASALLTEGGNFGCWRGDDGLSDNIQRACEDNYQHQGKLNTCRQCDILGVCIKFPTHSGPIVLPQPTDDVQSCGTIAAPDPRDRAPDGWELCYISIIEHATYKDTLCRDLLQDLVDPASGQRYPGYASLLSAGGNFGCWRGSEGMSSNIRAACQNNYQHTGRLSTCGHCDMFGVCIRYPS